MWRSAPAIPKSSLDTLPARSARSAQLATPEIDQPGDSHASVSRDERDYGSCHVKQTLRGARCGVLISQTPTMTSCAKPTNPRPPRRPESGSVASNVGRAPSSNPATFVGIRGIAAQEAMLAKDVRSPAPTYGSAGMAVTSSGSTSPDVCSNSVAGAAGRPRALPQCRANPRTAGQGLAARSTRMWAPAVLERVRQRGAADVTKHWRVANR